jgi:hypothetical protein
MFSVVRIFEGGGYTASDVPETARARVEALGRTTGFVTLLAIKGDDGALLTVEIFETLDDMRAAQKAAGRDALLSPSEGGPEGARTIAGEIVFQRGL